MPVEKASVTNPTILSSELIALNVFIRQFSCVEPFTDGDSCLAQDSPNESGIDRAAVGIGNREAKASAAHPQVLSSSEWPLEALAL